MTAKRKELVQSKVVLAVYKLLEDVGFDTSGNGHFMHYLKHENNLRVNIHQYGRNDDGACSVSFSGPSVKTDRNMMYNVEDMPKLNARIKRQMKAADSVYKKLQERLKLIHTQLMYTADYILSVNKTNGHQITYNNDDLHDKFAGLDVVYRSVKFDLYMREYDGKMQPTTRTKVIDNHMTLSIKEMTDYIDAVLSLNMDIVIENTED